MLVSDKLDSALDDIYHSPYISLDTETTGLDVHGEDTMFCMSVSTMSDDYFFTAEKAEVFKEEFEFNSQQTIFIHNAKFDLGILKKFGVDLSDHNVHCTYALGRVEQNTRPSLSLDTLAKEHGLDKSDEVKKYMDEHKLFEMVLPPGKKRRYRKYFYDQVPLHIMRPYCELDSRLGHVIGMKQAEYFKEHPEMADLVENEKKLVHVLQAMEERGISINPRYVKEAMRYEKDMCDMAAMHFLHMTGIQFKDSNKVFAEAFQKAGEPYPYTEKGNPCFNAEALKGMNTPIAKLIKQHRNAAKKAGTYYVNFLEKADDDNIIHCNFKQAGCRTGRLACAEPNLQNVSKRGEDSSLFPVRKSFVPRKGHSFFMIDYNQMEYILLMDYAEEMTIIEAVRNGMDVHQATADMIGTDRQRAKTINFALLYGCGKDQLAHMLGISVTEAGMLKDRYFGRLPKIKQLISRIMLTAEKRGYILNWFGRRYYFDSRDEVYKAPNYLIQGGCADIIKVAMVRIHELLKDYDTKMLLQVHDELLFEVPFGEEHVILKIKEIMESVRKGKHLPLTVSVEQSTKSWHDKEEYFIK